MPGIIIPSQWHKLKGGICPRGHIELSSFEAWSKEDAHLHKVLFWTDGPCSNVAVLNYEHETAMLTNGHVDATDRIDTSVQALVSAFPLLIKPEAKDIAVVGWGSGQTVGTALLFPVTSVDAIELEPAVVTASKYFHHVNGKPEEDPRVNIEFNDGRNFLLVTNKLYDLVISEPSNPWQAGVCNLFTREYFEICKRRLKPGGIFSLWMQMSEVPPRDIAGVLNAVNLVFPHALAFVPLQGNLVILASMDPITIDLPKVKKQFANAKIAHEMKLHNIDSAESFVGHIVAASDGLKSLKTAFVNTDDRNRLEFDVGKSYEAQEYVLANRRLLGRFYGKPWEQVNFGDISAVEKAAALAEIADACVVLDDPHLLLAWAAESMKLEPNSKAYELAGVAYVTDKDTKMALELWDKALKLNPHNVLVYKLRGTVYDGAGKVALARSDFEHMLEIEPKNLMARLLMAKTYFRELTKHPIDPGVSPGKDEPALKMLAWLGDLPETEFAKKHPDVLWVAGQANFRLRHFDLAERQMRQYFSIEPDKYFEYGKACLETIHKYQSADETKSKSQSQSQSHK